MFSVLLIEWNFNVTLAICYFILISMFLTSVRKISECT